MVQHFTTSDGLNLAYDVQGTGVPVLCLAGLTRNMDDFEPVVEHFADRAQIIRLDSRGRGASDHDPNVMNYTIRRKAPMPLPCSIISGSTRPPSSAPRAAG